MVSVAFNRWFSSTFFNWLVVWTPLKNMKVNGKIKLMFQTTNQSTIIRNQTSPSGGTTFQSHSPHILVVKLLFCWLKWVKHHPKKGWPTSIFLSARMPGGSNLKYLGILSDTTGIKWVWLTTGPPRLNRILHDWYYRSSTRYHWAFETSNAPICESNNETSTDTQ